MAPLRHRLLFDLITNQRLERGVRRSPTLQRRAYAAARRYVAGETVQDVRRVVAGLRGRGITASVDFFGELVTDPATAERATADYVQLARTLAQVQDAWLAIDLSHVGLDISVETCRRHLATIVEALPAGRRIQVGAEDASRTDPILQVVTALATQGAPLMATVQANLRRSPQDVARLAAAGVPVRLTKGAYVEPAGLAYPWGEETDVAFLRLAHQLREAGAAFSLATHDPVLREALLLALGPSPVEMLLGVRPQDARDLVGRGVGCAATCPTGRTGSATGCGGWPSRRAHGSGRRPSTVPPMAKHPGPST
jgi:proline dehydrogenase